MRERIRPPPAFQVFLQHESQEHPVGRAGGQGPKPLDLVSIQEQKGVFQRSEEPEMRLL